MAKNGVAKDGLQSEYINNLQQQVYFLELELQIMKEKATTGQFAGRSSISKTAPIDSHVNSLRDKYNYMEKKFKKKFTEVEEKLDTISSERDILQSKLSRVDAQLQDNNQKMEYYEQVEETLKKKHLEEKLTLELVLSKKTDKLEEKESIYEKQRKDYQEFRLSTRKNTLKHADEMTELRHEMAKLKEAAQKSEEKAKSASRDLLEAQEESRLKDEKIQQKQKEVSKIKDELIESENRFKKAKMDLEVLKTHSEKFEQQCLQQSSLNEDLEGQLHAIKQEKQDELSSENRWSHRLVNFQSENTMLKTKVGHLKKDLETRYNEKVELQEKLSRMQEELRDREEKISGLETEIILMKKSMEHLETSNLQLKRDNILQKESATNATDKVADLEEKLNEKMNSLDKLRITHSQMSAKLETSKSLENINFEEVTRLSAASQNINKSIQDLLSKIKVDASINDN